MASLEPKFRRTEEPLSEVQYGYVEGGAVPAQHPRIDERQTVRVTATDEPDVFIVDAIKERLVTFRGGVLEETGEYYQFDGMRTPIYKNVPLPPNPRADNWKPLKWREEEPPEEYHWIVAVGAIAGTVVGFLVAGPVGAIVGGAAIATAMVPVRRHYAAEEDPHFEERNMSLAAEMGVTAGVNLAIGGAVGVLGKGATLASAGIKAVVAKTAIGKATDSATAQAISTFYTSQTTQIVLRSTAGAVAVYDMVTDEGGNFNPEGLLHNEKGEWSGKEFQIDHWWGFAAAIYSGNAVFSRAFGANLYGLDTAAPFSIASYKAFRWMAGEDLTDFSEFNFEEAFMWRYIAETGNVLTNVGTYGRAYMRPDLRQKIAGARGLAASKETGTPKPAPALWFLDKTLGSLYRAAPNVLGFKSVVRPLVAYEAGETILPNALGTWVKSRFPNLGKRLTVIDAFKANDMMKPEYGAVGGRLMNLVYQWCISVPWWYVSSTAVGMNPKSFGKNRLIKFTIWPIFGKPVKDGFGGDTVLAQAAGFLIGLGMDTISTQVANGRFDKLHWSKDFHASLAAYNAATTDEERDRISEHVLSDIFGKQMTDWSYTSMRMLEGYTEFNPAYLETFAAMEETLTPEEDKAMGGIFFNRVKAYEEGRLGARDIEGLTYLRTILAASEEAQTAGK